MNRLIMSTIGPRLTPQVSRLTLHSMCLALVALLMASTAHAQSYPAKPIRMVVPVPPGGIVDVVGRLLGQKMTEHGGQNVLIDNRPGGLTNVGSEFVARSAGDGYTLLLQSLPMVINPMVLGKMPYDYEKDLAPVSLTVKSPYLWVVHPSVPARSMKELVALAKARPGKVTYSSAGNASNLHVAMELFNVLAGVSMLHIPYKGGGPALTAVLGGEADLSVLSASAVLPHINTRHLRALAITSPQRMSALPDMPTVAQSGVPDYEFASWVGVMAPGTTPPALLTQINALAVKAARSPDLIARFTRDATEVVADSPAQFRAFIHVEARRWARVVKAAHIRAQ
jgi:tripartite-type tricarboxylate transporter receptor subunit TctC